MDYHIPPATELEQYDTMIPDTTPTTAPSQEPSEVVIPSGLLEYVYGSPEYFSFNILFSQRCLTIQRLQ